MKEADFKDTKHPDYKVYLIDFMYRNKLNTIYSKLNHCEWKPHITVKELKDPEKCFLKIEIRDIEERKNKSFALEQSRFVLGS